MRTRTLTLASAAALAWPASAAGAVGLGPGEAPAVGTAFYDIEEAAPTRDGRAIDVLHVSSNGHVLQRVALGGIVETRSVALEGGGQWNSSPALAELTGGRALYVRDTYDRALVARRFAGGDLYAAGAWRARRLVAEPLTALLSGQRVRTSLTVSPLVVYTAAA